MVAVRRTGTNPAPNAGATTLLPPIRDEVADALERLSRLLVQRVPDPLQGQTGHAPSDADIERIRAAVRFLGQVASGWQNLVDDALPDDAAGFGSTVEVEDVDAGGRETYTLMTGALLDIDAGQVSLASPIGQALVGCTPGMIVTVETPQRRRTLRVLSVRTLRERVQEEIAVA